MIAIKIKIIVIVGFNSIIIIIVNSFYYLVSLFVTG